MAQTTDAVTTAARPAEPRKYSPAEAREIVDEVWRIGLEDVYDRVWNHPFTRELQAGTLPIEVVRGFICNWYVLAQEVNASSGASFYGKRAFYARFPDLEAIRAEGTADEFTAPGPGGHQRTIEGVARALGISREELADYHCIPEMRAYLDSIIMAQSESLMGGADISEEWLSEWFKVWTRSMQEHYGLSEEDVFYFVMHSEADGPGEHYGGPTIDDDVMGHADRNKYIARKVLEAGLAPPDPLNAWIRISKGGTDGALMMLDGCYERFHPRHNKLRGVA